MRTSVLALLVAVWSLGACNRECGTMNASAGGVTMGEEPEWCGDDYDTFGMYAFEERIYQLFPDSADSLENDAALLLIPSPVVSWWDSDMIKGAVLRYPDDLAGVAVMYDPSYGSLVNVPLVEGTIEILSDPKPYYDYGQTYRVRWDLRYDDIAHLITASGEDDVAFSDDDIVGSIVTPPGEP